MDLNKISVEISEIEGLKDQINIAQIKEVLRIIFTRFSLTDLVRIYLKTNRIKI